MMLIALGLATHAALIRHGRRWAACGTPAPAERITDDSARVTCLRCRRSKRREGREGLEERKT